MSYAITYSRAYVGGDGFCTKSGSVGGAKGPIHLR
jgi:hypothetical protein